MLAGPFVAPADAEPAAPVNTLNGTLGPVA
jgi:hypothetical protein